MHVRTCKYTYIGTINKSLNQFFNQLLIIDAYSLKVY